MAYEPPQDVSGGKPLPERPANTTNAQDYTKPNEQKEKN